MPFTVRKKAPLYILLRVAHKFSRLKCQVTNRRCRS